MKKQNNKKKRKYKKKKELSNNNNNNNNITSNNNNNNDIILSDETLLPFVSYLSNNKNNILKNNNKNNNNIPISIPLNPTPSTNPSPSIHTTPTPLKLMTTNNNIKKQINARPNVFLSIKIDDLNISNKLKEIQDTICENDPQLIDACINCYNKLHITLFVFRIDNLNDIINNNNEEENEELNKIKNIFLECSERIKNNIFQNNLLDLEFIGLKTFKKNVLYMNPIESLNYHRLYSLATDLYNEFISHGLIIPNEKDKIDDNLYRLDFKPHATIMKLSKIRKKRNKRNKKKPLIRKEYYQQFENYNFGTYTFKTLELLDMQRIDDDGYYKRLAQISLI